MIAAISALIASEGAAEGNGPWIPHDPKEVLWGTIAVLLVIGVLVWKAGPAIKAALAARPARIAKELDDATAGREAAEGKLSEIKTALADSDKEADRIIAEARETAAKHSADLDALAATDAAAIKERAASELVAARRQAQSDLSAEVSRLALGAAEKVVASNLDDSTQQSLIEQYIGQVGSSN